MKDAFKQWEEKWDKVQTIADPGHLLKKRINRRSFKEVHVAAKTFFTAASQEKGKNGLTAI